MCKDNIFHIAIIDYLVKFSRVRHFERVAKSLINNIDIDTISCAPPEFYAQRFKWFMENQLFNL